MPNKSIPTLGDSNWGVTLNSHLAQLQNPTTGGINSFEQFSLRPTNLTTDDLGKTYLYTQTGNIHQWTGTAWKVLNESVINVKDYGAIGDGVVDDTAAIQKCANFNISGVFGSDKSKSKNSIFIPDGIYTISGNGVKFGEFSDIKFQSPQTTLKYLGTTQCIHIDGVHKFTMSNGFIDLSAAGVNSTGVNMQGAWLWSIYDLQITLASSSNQTGIFLQTTTSGGYNYGNYCGNLKNVLISGSGKYGIHALTNDKAGVGPGGRADVTNLTIDGGWIVSPEYPMYCDGVLVAKVNGTCLALGVNAITIKDSADINLSLGETGPCSGYNIFVENSIRVYDFASSVVNLGILGYSNTQLIGINNGSLTLSTPDSLYSFQMKSNYNYTNPFELLVNGGSPAIAKIIEYSEANGSKFGTLYHDGVINLKPNGDTIVNLLREFADNSTALTAGLTIGTLYRTGDLLKVVH